MKKLLLSIALLGLMGQGCLSSAKPEARPTPAPTPIPESSEQNMPPQDNTTPPPTPGPSTYNVTIQNFAFAQASITVRKGDKIIFQNRDSAGHTATADKGAFDSGIIEQGKSFTLDTSKLSAGTYPYHCAPHPDMKGTVVVR